MRVILCAMILLCFPGCFQISMKKTSGPIDWTANVVYNGETVTVEIQGERK